MTLANAMQLASHTLPVCSCSSPSADDGAGAFIMQGCAWIDSSIGSPPSPNNASESVCALTMKLLLMNQRIMRQRTIL